MNPVGTSQVCWLRTKKSTDKHYASHWFPVIRGSQTFVASGPHLIVATFVRTPFPSKRLKTRHTKKKKTGCDTTSLRQKQSLYQVSRLLVIMCSGIVSFPAKGFRTFCKSNSRWTFNLNWRLRVWCPAIWECCVVYVKSISDFKLCWEDG